MMNQYNRADGVIGLGFEITWSGKKMHSIAWPDVPAERMTEEEMARKNCVCEPLEVDDDSEDAPNPEAIGTLKSQVAFLEKQNAELAEEVARIKQEGAELSEQSNSNQESADKDVDVSADPPVSEAQSIRDYLTDNPDAENSEVIAALAKKEISVTSAQVSRQRKKLTATAK